MSDLQELLERFADEGEPRGATAVFADAVNAGACRRRRRNRAFVASASALVLATGGIVFALVARQDDLRVQTINSGPSATIALLTHADGGDREQALGGGVLRFDAERRCVYLEDRDGTRILPQWPEGYYARSDPLRVYDAAGALVAEEGKVVTFGGGFHDPAELGSGTETCGVDRRDGLFIMGERVTTAPGPACSTPSRFGTEYSEREVRGTSANGQLWGLAFGPVPPRVGQELKIVWRMTGTGPLRVVFTAPDGSRQPLVFGPDGPRASTYSRPGDEWGTAFRFTASGCWHIHLTRDDTSGDVWLTVR